MSAEEFKQQGNRLFLQKQYPEAIDMFTQAINLDSNNHILYSNRSACYASLKDYKKALEDGEKTVSLQPNWAKGYGRKAAALFGLGRLPEAEKAYETGLTHEPTNALLQKGLQETQQAMETEASTGIAQFFGPDLHTRMAANPKLRKHLNDADLMAKIAEIQANPKDLNKHMNDPKIMALIIGLMGLEAQTGAEFAEPGARSEAAGDSGSSRPEASASSKPSSSAEAPNKAKEEKQEAQDVEMPSEEELKKKEDVAAAIAAKDLGNAAYKKRKFDEALEQYAKAWELDSTNISILTNKAAVYFEMGKYDECIKTCEEAIDVGREHRADYKLIAKALGRIGTAYTKLNNHAEAIKFFNKSLTEHRTPDILAKLKEAEKVKANAEREAYRDVNLSAEARERGNALFKQHNYAEAIKEYTEAIKRDDSDSRAYSNRSACYIKLMAVNEASKDAEMCIKLDPKFAKGYLRRAAVQFIKKEYEDCLETCKQAQEVDVDKKSAAEIQQQIQKVYKEMNTSFQRRDGETDEEVLRRAQQDPEIMRLMSDPAMRAILQQMQEDPKAAAAHLQNPTVAANIRKLVAAGIIRTG